MLRGPCCPAYPFLWSCRLRAPVRYHLGQAQWSSLMPILCCLPCPSVWTDSLSTLPAVSSQCPVNKLQLSAHLHLGPISCRSLTPTSHRMATVGKHNPLCPLQMPTKAWSCKTEATSEYSPEAPSCFKVEKCYMVRRVHIWHSCWKSRMSCPPG